MSTVTTIHRNGNSFNKGNRSISTNKKINENVSKAES